METEFLEGSLQRHGYKITNLDDAQIIIVNTCGFIETAKQESIDTILQLAKRKEDCNCNALIVTGCLAQRYREVLLKEMPEVDGAIGISHLRDMHLYVSEIVKGKRICKAGSLPSRYSEDRIRNIPDKPSAYMQISDGCDNFCTYCAIPMIRGIYRSRSIKSLLSEAKDLIAHGVKEIVLIGNDTGCYGHDIYGKPKIDSLIKELANLEELEWIRVLYCQPHNLSDKLIGTIASSHKVCPYVDIPFQHASKRILTKMGRRGDSKEYLELIERMRSQIPDVAIRTSFIVGFPGEADRDFEELIRFVEEAGFDYIGLFEYSSEEDTVAHDLPNEVPKEIVRERFRVISDLRDLIALNKGKLFLGKKVQVLLESILGEEDGLKHTCYQGRTIYQAPEIDGETQVKADRNGLKIGDIVEAKINKVDIYDFEGELEC